jgi:hypothetical protein
MHSDLPCPAIGMQRNPCVIGYKLGIEHARLVAVAHPDIRQVPAGRCLHLGQGVPSIVGPVP